MASRVDSLHDTPARHVQDAVGVVMHFRDFVGDQQDRQALVGEVADDLVDAGAGADIDAHRRAIEDQKLRFGGQPFGQHHPLLVAARKRRDRILGLADLDAEFGDPAPKRFRLSGGRNEAVRP